MSELIRRPFAVLPEVFKRVIDNGPQERRIPGEDSEPERASHPGHARSRLYKNSCNCNAEIIKRMNRLSGKTTVYIRTRIEKYKVGLKLIDSETG